MEWGLQRVEETFVNVLPIKIALIDLSYYITISCVVSLLQTAHRKTLFYLEQMILKYKAHVSTSSINQVPGTYHIKPDSLYNLAFRMRN